MLSSKEERECRREYEAKRMEEFSLSFFTKRRRWRLSFIMTSEEEKEKEKVGKNTQIFLHDLPMSRILIFFFRFFPALNNKMLSVRKKLNL